MTDRDERPTATEGEQTVLLGETFWLDMGPQVRIGDLADRLIQSAVGQGLAPVPIDIVGLRPGEKMVEELASQGIRLACTPHPRVWVAHQASTRCCPVAQNADEPRHDELVQEIRHLFLRQYTDGMEGLVADDLLLLERPVILGGGSGLMVPRTVFDEVGGFDIRLSTSADWDLFYQISSRYEIGFVPEILLRYRVHGSNMHGNIKVMERDMKLAFSKALGTASTASSRKRYGNLYKTLAGSYFRAGNYGSFARSALRSLSYHPANLVYFAKFPLRRMAAGSKETN